MSGETASELSGWTVDTLKEHTSRMIDDLRTTLQERYDNQLVAVERAFAAQQRAVDQAFAGQQRAVDTAFAGQTKAVDSAFAAAERAVNAALSSAETAVAKAEVASEKRFESVNEFRAQLGDQAATFLPRVEYIARHEALIDRLNNSNDRVNALELRLTSRLDVTRGETSGRADQVSNHRLDAGQMVAVASLLLLVISVAVGILVATR